MKVGMVSLGCSKNLMDSEKIMGMLSQGGHQVVVDPKDADVILVNTCGFIEPAKVEAINTTLEMAEFKNYNCKKLYMLGCLAQRYKKDLEASMPEVDRIISIDEYDRINEYLNEDLKDGNCPSWSDADRLVSTPKHMAYLKIAEGCGNFCSFCAIPLIRGRFISKPMEEILKEAKQLEERGVKEVVLIAQDTTRYGVDLYKKYYLAELLKELDKLDFKWIRILYMYPEAITHELVDTIAASKHVLPYFDVPLQSGNDRILDLMRRRNHVEDAMSIIEYIRKKIPNAIFRTTFIAGFPTEKKAEFNDTMRFAKTVGFDRLGAFPYSKEEGTYGATLTPEVPKKVRQARYDRLMKQQMEISKEKSAKLVGEVLECVVEGQEQLTSRYKARSMYSAPDDVDGYVYFKSPKVIEMGEFVKVKITRSFTYDLEGELVD